MPKDFKPGTVLKGIGPNTLKERLIVSFNEDKNGYLYKDPLNITAKGKVYDSNDSIDPWFDKNWVIKEEKPESGMKQPLPGTESTLKIRTEESEE